MSIQIGAKPESSFNDPLGLLSDCHRRIEKFLDTLIAVTQEANGDALSERQKEALEVALRYFEKAAPLHSQDEEASLFPLLRSAGEEARQAFVAIDALESQHREADMAHAEIDRLGRKWLAEVTLPPDETETLRTSLTELREMYRGHIAVEDTQIFPLAGKVLARPALANVGREMARRRGLDPDNLPSISRCQVRKIEQNKA